MRIYLDNCVYQDLKKEENKELYNNIIKSKLNHLYLFSEAHLYDLSRDTTDEKYKDMEIIESICDNNCLLSDKNGARLLTSKEYYDMFDWDSTNKFEANLDNSDPLWELIISEFEKIPLPFNEIFKPNVFPSKFPIEFDETFREHKDLGFTVSNSTV